MKFICMLACVIFCMGCASSSKNTVDREMKESLQSVAEGITGQKLTEKQIDELVTSIEKDEETQTAVQSVTDALSGHKAIVKYCPEDGKRYSAHLEFCPGTKIPLKILE